MTFWAPDAGNNGRPLRPDMIRVILEDIYRTFPDYCSEVVESVAVDDLVITLSRVSRDTRRRRPDQLQWRTPAERQTYGPFRGAANPLVALREGKIVWHQGGRDDLRMLQQLGLMTDSLDPTLKVAPGR